MNGCWKKLYSELAARFEGFEKIPGAATEELVQLMNVVSTEDVDELIFRAYFSEDLTVMQEANKAPPHDKDDEKII
jgi:hypothetical protein